MRFPHLRPPLLAAWSAAFCALAGLASAASQPNVVFIMCDDLGWGDVAVHGGNVPTPNIDKLAHQGVDLAEYYVAPVCTPTRAALMTGRYWTRFGVYTVKTLRSLPFDTVTTPRAFKAKGYDTALIGKWHLGSSPDWGPNHYGFDFSYGSLGGGVGPFDHFYKFGPFMHTWHRNEHLITETGHITDLDANEAVKWIHSRTAAPFFLYLPFQAVHLPVKEPQKWLDRVPASITGDVPRHYGAAIMHMDWAVGQVVEALEKTGKRDNTLIVFTSDNGATTVENSNQPYPPDNYPKGRLPGNNGPFRGEKAQLYDGGIHVACFVNWPGVLKPSKVRQPIDVVDWMPTFSDLIGYTPPKDLKWDGINVWPYITGENKQLVPRLLYFGYVRGSVLIDGDWKLIENKPTKTEAGTTELFDLATDPYETRDVAAQMPEKVQSLKGRLKTVMKNDKDSEVPADPKAPRTQD